MTSLTVDRLAERVARHRPHLRGEVWAATALVLGEGPGGPSALLIRRATSDGDRWSGDMALPGGKVDPGDVTAEAAAVRETAEEVGIVLADPVGRLDDLVGRPSSLTIATVVFTLPDTPAPVPEPGEVAEAVWLPLSALADPGSRTWYRYGGVVPFRSITVGEHMIWGLTHRILTHFFAVAGLD